MNSEWPTQLSETQAIRKELETFAAFLKKKGLKVTNQRLLVAQKIFSMQNHFTADSLMETLMDRRQEISKATIYRIITIMLDAGLLAEHDFGEGYRFYEHTLGQHHHDHIICQDCNRIVEFVDERIEKLQEEAAGKKGFKIAGHRLNIYGKCQRKSDCSHYQEYIKRNK
ncbi:MAG: Fur family transcriptional regulator [Spirochaetota bacterium]